MLWKPFSILKVLTTHLATSYMNCTKRESPQAYYDWHGNKTFWWFIQIGCFCQSWTFQERRCQTCFGKDLWWIRKSLSTRRNVIFSLSRQKLMNTIHHNNGINFFNHEKYLGNEDCTAIFGFRDLYTIVTLKNGTSLTLRMLLKSIPSAPGVTKSRMFQIIDPNATQMCIIATFQKADHEIIK